MRKSDPDLPRQFKTPWVPVVPILGILVCGAMIFGLGWTNWARLGGWLVIGFIIYFGYSRYHSKLQQGVVVEPTDPPAPKDPEFL
jgi:APA family basic amino acid/polyamine antiporter